MRFSSLIAILPKKPFFSTQKKPFFAYMRFSSIRTILPRKPFFSTQKKPFFSTQTTLQNHPDACSPSLESRFISLILTSVNACDLKRTHAQIFRHGLSETSNVIRALISACCRFLFKSIEYPLSIFRLSRDRDRFLFYRFITILLSKSPVEDSIYMQRRSIHPDSFTSARSLLYYDLTGALHASIIRLGLDLDSFIQNRLALLYVRFRSLDHALQFFEVTPEKVVLGNLLINRYCEVGNLEMAINIFMEMPEKKISSWIWLINGFFRNGHMEMAIVLFDHMPEKNESSWSAMVTGFLQNGDHQRALSTFFRMLDEGVKPDDLVVFYALSSCVRIGALDAGIRIHEYVLRSGFQINELLGYALVDMYSECGEIESARRVFCQIKEKDVRIWTAMISGWAIHGCCGKALRCFEEMKSAGIHPNKAVFLVVLRACSQSGLVDQGLQVFNSMCLDNSITPTVNHYACIVDLFVRVGHLEKALKFIESMPIKPNFMIWGTLFCACRTHKNIKMAELASNRLLQLEPNHPRNYVFLSNIYAKAGRWEDVERVRNLMKTRSIDKPLGRSFIEAGGHVHSFTAGDRAHTRMEEIYKKLEEITTYARTQGYVPDTDGVLHNIEEEDKEDAFRSHSEKLALAFGLVSTLSPTVIRIVKDLRVCGDCHALMKHVSKISEREIVLRDIKRFHHFKDGACTCRDYW